MPLPLAEQQRDRLFNAPVKRLISQVEYSGVIAEISVGSRSSQRVYRVQYDDGDEQDITEKEAAASWVATL